MTPEELEALVSRKLARLPLPRAPESLLPSILAVIRVRGIQPSDARSWPVPIWFAVAGWLAIVVGVVWLIRASPTVGTATEFNVLASAASLLWRAFIEPNLQPLAVLVGAMSVLSALYLRALSYMLKGNEVSREKRI